MSVTDDTQPKSPFRGQPPQSPPPGGPDGPLLDPDAPDSGGPGCAFWAITGSGALAFMLIIIVLAGAAGWTSGQRIVASNATATYNAEINTQLDLIAGELAQGTLEMASNRIRYLETRTPGIPRVIDLAQTATAAHLTAQPSPTPTATETMTPSPTVESVEVTEFSPTSEPAATAGPGGRVDLGALLSDAQAAVSLAQWEEAIENLNIIIRVDSTYETATVRSLMSRSLNARARELYISRDPANLAEAIRLTDLAEEFGPLADGLNFERDVALLYRQARSLIGTGNPSGTISVLQQVRSLAPDYMDTTQLLANQYAAFGDALLVSDPCSAVNQYTNALSIFNSGAISAKRTQAETWCAQGTPTPEGFVATPDPNAQPTIAPVGQPGS